MIKIINTGSGLQVNNTHANWPAFYNQTANGNTLIGQVRYNGSNQNFEVYDGNSWLIVGVSYPMIELAPHVQAVVAWAQTKMAEEARLQKLAEQHPTVADAVAAVKLAEQQLQAVVALTTV